MSIMAVILGIQDRILCHYLRKIDSYGLWNGTTGKTLSSAAIILVQWNTGGSQKRL